MVRAAPRRRKELGQNFLRDPNILGVIERASEPSEDDVVLEIGGGEGVLSAHLAPKVKWLHVIEFDERLKEPLQGAVADAANVTIWWGDAMKLDLQALRPAPTKLIANLPYGIAASVLLRTVEELPSLQTWVAMVQREVGERLAAAPGNGLYGVSSVLAQLACDVKVVRAIPRTVFAPMPNVDSALVKLVRRGQAASPQVRRLVKAAFAHRRKALARSLALGGIGCERVQEALLALGHRPDVRAERLAPADYVALAEELGL